VCVVEASYINASNAENMKNVWHVIKHTADRTVEGSKMQATASGIESKMKMNKKKKKNPINKPTQYAVQIIKYHY